MTCVLGNSILKKLILSDHTDTRLHSLSLDMFESRGSDWSKYPTCILIGAGVGEPQPSMHTQLKDEETQRAIQLLLWPSSGSGRVGSPSTPHVH